MGDGLQEFGPLKIILKLKAYVLKKNCGVYPALVCLQNI